MKPYVSNSLAMTREFAEQLIKSFPEVDGATVVALSGNLGSGKTTLTQMFAEILGVKDYVTSPTFVIEKIYETNSIFKRLIHIDAYRLESGRELQDLNFEELVENKNNLILIEWPENVKEILPEERVQITCEFVDENTRKFTVEYIHG